jgi:hypothetical protein
MNSSYYYPILFVLILGFVIFSLIHYGRNVDSNIQKYLEKFFLNRIPFIKCTIEKSSLFLKRLGELHVKNLTFSIDTNSLNGLLNRQVVFEIKTELDSNITFFIERNVYFRANRDKSKDWNENFNLYPIAYSKLGSISSSLKIAIGNFDLQKKKSIITTLESSKVIDNLLSIPNTLKILGLPAINQYWKIFIDGIYLGFAIDETWIKKISQKEMENFFEIILKIHNHLFSLED